MAIQAWKPSTIYLPGALVVPTTIPGVTSTAIPNADFESGDTGWTKGTGWAINTNDAFAGTYSAEYSGPGVATLINDAKVSVAPGKAITAKCFIQHGASAAGEAAGAVILQWYDAGDAPISTSTGNSVSDGAVGIWKESTVSATAPAGAAFVSIGVSANNDWTPLWADNFQWNYVQGSAASLIIYKSVSATTGVLTDISFFDEDPDVDRIHRDSGSFVDDGFQKYDEITVAGSASNDGDFVLSTKGPINLWLSADDELVAEGTGASVTITAKGKQGISGSEEPTWPGSAGSKVVDNDILWEAVEADSVTWEASSILTSGGSEPTWPEEAGAFVSDNNIAWKTVPLRIEDERCPHTKVVAIAASKVFAGGVGGDTVRFCATLNARDWTTEEDAGFLPSGLQQKSQVGVDAMGVYRANLAVWSGSTFQLWQVDPDPAAMALIDAMEGIGSVHQQAVQPVSDDLFFLAALGVRTVSIAEGSNNLATGDTGVPIDVLVQAEVDPTVEPIATYFSGAGQYWLAFRALTVPLLMAGQFLLTSPVYPIEFEDAVVSQSAPDRGRLVGIYFDDAIVQGTEPRFGLLAGGLTSTNAPDDAIISDSEPRFGLLAGGLTVTTSPEDAIISDTEPRFAIMAGALIRYENWEDAIISDDTEPQDSTLV